MTDRVHVRDRSALHAVHPSRVQERPRRVPVRDRPTTPEGGDAGVLPAALEMVNRLQPEFVVSLGDLIEGYTDARRKPGERSDLSRVVARNSTSNSAELEMPFFFIAGNHDINNPPSVAVWRERYGGDPRVLPLPLQGCPVPDAEHRGPAQGHRRAHRDDPEQAKVIDDAYHAIKDAIAAGCRRTSELLELARADRGVPRNGRDQRRTDRLLPRRARRQRRRPLDLRDDACACVVGSTDAVQD